MDEELRSSCLRLFEACLAQIRSGTPGPRILTSREFEATLVFLCERLKAYASRTDTAPPDGNYIHMIVRAGAEEAVDGLAHLRNWLRGAQDVIICDPYLLKFSRSDLYQSVEDYAQALAKLIPASAKQLDLYTNSYQSAVRPVVLNALKEGRNVRHFSTNLLHDRFVLKDGSEGKMIGTSFSGFGRKFFGMLDLEPTDVAAVRRELFALCPNPIQGGRRHR
ncbi:hypothetical protein FHT72_006825 [Rhizobium sp. BK077]|uniref:hypothetical protein n=1 Tax=Rhizobium TaxID=379 RepID=UPI000BE83FAF|nr:MULTISPECIES: hypothetical protein [Rhizobium]MBB3302844.1 hypothetical protein [Rhizobium sp. BK112]MBB3372289.1 hypothetical protein [Rhizobium sp. BK077]MBB4182704.1 hypothetical protein [Rhizobium sp. BK109]PDS54540.1 hypothetical protein CO663_34730 [Rhizobium anhuiense]